MNINWSMLAQRLLLSTVLFGTGAWAQVCDEVAQNKCGPSEFCIAASEFSGKSMSILGYPMCVERISPEVLAHGCSGETKSYSGCQYRWSGPISLDSVALLEKSVRSSNEVQHSQRSTKMSINITSEGGDIYAAMRLGRLLRSHSSSIHVTDYCASACVLVLAGAVDRWALYGGEVLIHRPYATAVGEVGLQTRQQMLDKRREDIEDYLEEMNIPAELLDEMNAVPPHRGRRLSESELEYFLLHGRDPAWEEEQNAKEAAKMGISMEEYLRRRQKRLMCLEDGRTASDCFDEFKKGK